MERTVELYVRTGQPLDLSASKRTDNARLSPAILLEEEDEFLIRVLAVR